MSHAQYPLAGQAHKLRETISSRGLIALMRYDPHSPRCFEGMKANLLDGLPTIIRLHAGANYPNAIRREQIDLEGQAVLVVGYDDSKEAFAIIDPFQRTPGKSPEITWLPYEQLATTIVDISLGEDIPPTNLKIDVVKMEGQGVIEISIGLPEIYGTITDYDLLTLEEVRMDVKINCKDNSLTTHHALNGKYPLGTGATTKVFLPKSFDDSMDVSIKVDGMIHGSRPYDYRDHIGLDYSCTFTSQKIEAPDTEMEFTNT